AVDQLGYLLQSLRWYRQCHQGTGPGAAVFEYRPDPGQHPAVIQSAQTIKHLGLAAAQFLGHGLPGLGAQRQLVLVAFDQALAQVVQLHVSPLLSCTPLASLRARRAWQSIYPEYPAPTGLPRCARNDAGVVQPERYLPASPGSGFAMMG